MDKEYKYTKKLLKVAIEENGYRNKDIAVKAGLSEKSVAQVSKWRNGRATATERQMNYFISNYEYLLKPKIEHLFYTFTGANHQSSVQKPTYKKITGEVIFKHQLAIRLNSKNNLSICRLIIITHNNQYYFVEQIRAGLLLPEDSHHVNGDRQVARSCNEEANWVVAEKIKSNLNIDELIVAVNEYCQKLQYGEPNLKRQGIRALPDQDINALEYSFYQKLMKLNLHSELLPF
ncbi:hypothetical protein [Colwellia sp. BRX10-4]|uniref:hypothetical protein n=1 Tax=Colwellia sp. BRX10-4 TaxID=2759843 RepID=UPI0015F49E96|nr:hypothetical protein [Colwellia sp. BRX10-4]MBA6398997.1 hypothetical protein [Colwellia sp. BRX10-4]